jgi:hypothetical protein
MRDLSQYSLKEWLLFEPMVACFKVARDAVLRDLFCNRTAAGFDRFMSEQSRLRGRRVAVIIAHEEAWLIAHQAARLARFVPDFVPIVFDNSLSEDARAAIARACAEANVAYLALPRNPIRNINRSHGNALNWVYRNVIRALEPELFALLDHDIFPRAQIDLSDQLGDQPFYGVKLDQGFGWALWAGYSVFRFSAIRNIRLDFNPDMDRGLITGGRNYAPLYRPYDSKTLRFASRDPFWIRDEAHAIDYLCEAIDGWFHIGGPAFRQHKATSRGFFEPLLKKPTALDAYFPT